MVSIPSSSSRGSFLVRVNECRGSSEKQGFPISHPSNVSFEIKTSKSSGHAMSRLFLAYERHHTMKRTTRLDTLPFFPSFCTTPFGFVMDSSKTKKDMDPVLSLSLSFFTISACYV